MCLYQPSRANKQKPTRSQRGEDTDVELVPQPIVIKGKVVMMIITTSLLLVAWFVIICVPESLDFNAFQLHEHYFCTRPFFASFVREAPASVFAFLCHHI